MVSLGIMNDDGVSNHGSFAFMLGVRFFRPATMSSTYINGKQVSFYRSDNRMHVLLILEDRSLGLDQRVIRNFAFTRGSEVVVHS